MLDFETIKDGKIGKCKEEKTCFYKYSFYLLIATENIIYGSLRHSIELLIQLQPTNSIPNRQQGAGLNSWQIKG